MASRLRGDLAPEVPRVDLEAADVDRAARGPVPARKAGGSVSAGPQSLMQFLPIGREDSPETASNEMREETRWIGKPWRRIELLRHRYFYKGENFTTERTLSIHLGSRRLGLFLTLILVRAPGYDYSE